MNTEPRVDFARAARLSPLEFLACWEVLDLGDPPLALALRPVGRTIDEHDRIHRDALAGLARRGLAVPAAAAAAASAQPRLVPSPPLAAGLRLLATAPTLGDLRLSGTDSPDLVAVGAMAREHGVLAVLRDGELTLLPVAGPTVPTTLVELVGPLTPARARPVNIPAEVLDRACRAAEDGNLWQLADRLIELGVPAVDAHSLARMCTGITAAGQLGVTARDRGGRDRRARWVVGFHRGRHGDCLQLRRPTGAGRETVTIAPITTDKLLAQFTGLLRDAHLAAA